MDIIFGILQPVVGLEEALALSTGGTNRQNRFGRKLLAMGIPYRH